ncbi:hypothetical protein SARC_04974 [Sphaeroforma arctica JP610]|uniref:CTLH domain-containing protein n=1 Tax=Sphaeroforma arctica JP610 TaxID=667725 RepID=A0A0L0G0U3_9EUKA|nr:hypothetical protein SARC_04974 [Sphaeroforma arctica JP610]KNC82732.1 hypothetical protein SARC_04974 [Sphaeroforma arctica JP610]|eukprot:XP_014156634.1 hypothetical protein SARC_04974 [Sphaeroforma arctica JP610]
MVSQNNSSSKQKNSIAQKDWQERLDNTEVDKNDLRHIVMNYLVIEGYKDAAESFRDESGVDPELDLSSIADRMKIRNAVQSGDITTAKGLVNDLNPEILDTNTLLYFHLQQQHLIELIRENRIDDAIDFAREELAAKSEESPNLLEELERTMSLIAFENAESSPMGYLLSPTQRQMMASELNAAILASQCLEKDPRLPLVLKMLVHAQDLLGKKTIFPHLINAVDGTLVLKENET